MTRYAIGLGSNQGDRLGCLRSALDALAALGDIEAVSGLYETEPVGGDPQGPYLNAVAVLKSDMDPRALLAGLHSIEADHGRVRESRWGPRTLDLDIVTSDGPPVSDEALQIPHPRAHDREFVLRPLAAIWPDAPLLRGASAAQALERVPAQGVALVCEDWATAGPPR